MVNSRRKGKDFEIAILHDLQELGFSEAMTSRLGSKEADRQGRDFINTGFLAIQAKRGRKYANPSVIGEIQCDRDRGDVPVVVTKADHGETMAILSWIELRKMIRASLGMQKSHFSGNT